MTAGGGEAYAARARAIAALVPMPQLLPNHRLDLEHSGLSDTTIATWGVYSVETHQKWVLVQLGFGHLEPPALALPILPPDSSRPDLDNVMLKPDRPRRDNRGHVAKYEARPKSRNRIHAPLTVRDKLSDVAIPLVITEGQKKAEKAAQGGICAIALAGVWNWKDRIGASSFPISDFELFPLAGRRIQLCFDSDADSNTHVRQAQHDLATFLRKRFGAHVSITRLPPGLDGDKVGLDDFLLAHTVEDFWQLPGQEREFGTSGSAFSTPDWPDPAPLGDELLPVLAFDLELLPSSLRPLVQDVSERMQTPPDYAAAAAVVALAGCVGQRASIRPKAVDGSWVAIPNLWGAIIAPPGFMKSPVLRSITLPLRHIEKTWREDHQQASEAYETDKEMAELKRQAWKEQYKIACKKGHNASPAPENTIKPPAQKRLILTDSTFEKLHEILSDNPAGVLVLRDELTGWLAGLDRQGREQERAFFLEAWNGDSPFTIDRIGRGSVHVPAACVSLFGNIQPSRLRSYLSDAVSGGPGDDGLFQRFQVLVWPDTQPGWSLVDRVPNNEALATAERVFVALSKLSPERPVQARFAPDAQSLFFDWWAELEGKIRAESGLPPAMVAHLSKYRSLMPSLALLFELADLAAAGAVIGEGMTVSLDHARQAAVFCEYLESHARRVYACIISPETRAARELAHHIRARDLPEQFRTRDVYLKGWSGLDTPERVRGALTVLEDAGWVRRADPPASPSGGRPSEPWIVNPKVIRHA